MQLMFSYIHSGYYMAVSELTGDSYVVRTRPKGDGWMAINDSEGLILATGQSHAEAKAICQSYDVNNVFPAIERL